MTTDVRAALYALGVQAATEFLMFNNLPLPLFLTYAETLSAPSKGAPRAAEYLRRVVAQDSRAVGAGTGLYYDGHVFVNLPRCALPVQKPAVRSWSWPGWKTDRTPVGVVAHETGHHVEWALRRAGRLDRAKGLEWRDLLETTRGRTVSGYEPVPDEAWAETLRLFILNPDLLRRALEARYAFVTGLGLRPVSRLLRKGWRAVLANPAYYPAGERWVNQPGTASRK
jgi:hypothetical protein